MQSTGQTATQPVFFVPMHGSVMTKAIVFLFCCTVAYPYPQAVAAP
jgi:hypothetical protein